MKIGYYDRYPGDDPNEASLYKWIEKLKKKKYRWLYSLVMETLKDVEENCTDLSEHEKLERVERLSHRKEPIYEFRIPKTDRRGVARLYFGYVPGKPEQIEILTAEIKRNNGQASESRLVEAERRYRTMFKRKKP